MYIDSHTHLYSEAFENDVDQVVEQAISQGVERFFFARGGFQYARGYVVARGAISQANV